MLLGGTESRRLAGEEGRGEHGLHLQDGVTQGSGFPWIRRCQQGSWPLVTSKVPRKRMGEGQDMAES